MKILALENNIWVRVEPGDLGWVGIPYIHPGPAREYTIMVDLLSEGIMVEDIAQALGIHPIWFVREWERSIGPIATGSSRMWPPE